MLFCYLSSSLLANGLLFFVLLVSFSGLLAIPIQMDIETIDEKLFISRNNSFLKENDLFIANSNEQKFANNHLANQNEDFKLDEESIVLSLKSLASAVITLFAAIVSITTIIFRFLSKNKKAIKALTITTKALTAFANSQIFKSEVSSMNVDDSNNNLLQLNSLVLDSPLTTTTSQPDQVNNNICKQFSFQSKLPSAPPLVPHISAQSSTFSNELVQSLSQLENYEPEQSAPSPPKSSNDSCPQWYLNALNKPNSRTSKQWHDYVVEVNAAFKPAVEKLSSSVNQTISKEVKSFVEQNAESGSQITAIEFLNTPASIDESNKHTTGLNSLVVNEAYCDKLRSQKNKHK